MKTKLLTFTALLAISHTTNAQNFVWANTTNDSGKVICAKVATDNRGNIYATGFFRGTTNIGTSAVTAVDLSDYCLIKYDSSGHIKWVKTAGGAGSDAGTGICTDAAGNIYVAGYFHNSITLGATTLSTADTDFASDDLFIVKYDSSGNVLWARQSTGYGQVNIANIATDVNGNVYVSGQFNDSLTIGGVLLFDSGTTQTYLVKYDASGTFKWARHSYSHGLGSSGSKALATDSNGNIYITGFVDGTDSFGLNYLGSTGVFDIYLVKYNTNGDVIWSRRAGGSGPSSLNEGEGLVTDASGNVYLTGEIQGAADFGTILLSMVANPTMFLAKYDSTGTPLWVYTAMGAGLESRGHDIAISNIGDLFITGEYTGTMTLGMLPSVTCAGGTGGGSDIFVTKFSDGGFTWVASAGGTGDDAGGSVAVGGGIIASSGGFSGSAGFGPITLSDPVAGGGTTYVARLRDTTNTTAGIHMLTMSAINVYPNPVSSVLHVQQPDNSTCYYELSDLAGRQVMSGKLTGDIDVSGLVPGLYMLKIRSEQGFYGTAIADKRF